MPLLLDYICSFGKYNAFGVQPEEKNGFATEVSYRGYAYDADTGKYVLPARYYDPELGRFLQEDSYWGPGNNQYGEDGKPDCDIIYQSRNLYVYCANDPIQKIDCSGDYNREAAVAFAQTFGDEKAWKATGLMDFDQNCTNFVSFCLNAGGLHQGDDWYYNWAMMIRVGPITKVMGSYSLSWTVAPEMYRIFSNPIYGYSNGNVDIWTPQGVAYNAQYGGIQPGDIIFFCGSDGGTPSHVAIVVKVEGGEIYYAAHDHNYTEEPLSPHVGINKDVVVIVKIRDDA